MINGLKKGWNAAGHSCLSHNKSDKHTLRDINRERQSKRESLPMKFQSAIQTIIPIKCQ